MADPAVSFLLENLKRLLVYNIELISGVKEEVESVCSDFDSMRAFLKDSSEKRNEYEIVRALVRKIRDVAYRGEDIIDIFVVNAAIQNARNPMGNLIHAVDHSLINGNVAKEIEAIKAKVKEIYDNRMYGIEVLQAADPSKRSPTQKGPPAVEEDNVLGFDEEAKKIIKRLTEGSDQLEVVSIVGRGGLGKTYLAKRVYTDPAIDYQFRIRLWTYVSQVYDRREIFLGILSSLTQLIDQMYKMNDESLCEELCKRLKDEGKYLIVIDDVWTEEVWEDLKKAFPNTNRGSRILLTSRMTEVALHARDPNPHQLRCSTDDESWELICTKVFQSGSCPSEFKELEELGRQIAKKCHGLPLALVVVAGLLSMNEKAPEWWWEKVAEGVSCHVAQNPEECTEVLALGYKHLPNHLKACFIYFGIFLEDFEIPVWILLQQWLAEGLVQQREQECLEDTAEAYLEYLVDRNLVLVGSRRLNGQIKTCRILGMSRDLCLREAAEEKFLMEIERNVQDPSCSTAARRLCLHSQVLDYIISKPSGPHVRYFICFAMERIDLPPEHTSFICEPFKLIRVLDARSISLSRFPAHLEELVHLRYLALCGNIKVIPAFISNLWNLQTLIVETTSRDLDIRADICKMIWFRHLYTSGSSRLCETPAKTRKGHKSPIQTMSVISPDSCTENILARTPNLRKLDIRGKLATLLAEEKGGFSKFDSLAKLDYLESLKLLNDAFPRAPFEFKLPGLPQPYKFPKNLKKLTLSDTLLDWEHTSVLGKLPNLEVLKLKDFAFKGRQWEPLHGGFRHLKVLQIGRTNLVHWEASSQHFPRLEHVIVKHCTDLEAILIGLGDVSAL